MLMWLTPGSVNSFSKESITCYLANYQPVLNVNCTKFIMQKLKPYT